MNSRDSLALLAGLGTGYMAQNDKERAQKLQQDEIDWRNNLRQRDQAQYDADQKRKADLVTAAADVAPTPEAGTATLGVDPSANAAPMQGSGFGGVGTDPSAQPAPVATTYAVGDQTGMTKDAAAAAAASANAPTAQMARMSAALRANGDPMGAAQLDAQARQSQLGDIQLTAAQRQQHQQDFNDHLLGALPGGHSALAQFISESDGDGHGGKLQAKAVPSADGKSVTYEFTRPDGTVKKGPTFSNDQQGAVEAAFMLQQGMSPEMLVKHNEAKVKDAREQQATDQQGRYQQGMLALEQKKVDLERSRVVAAAAATGAKTVRDPVLQAKLGIAGKQLEQVAEQINKSYAADGYDPLKPPAGLKQLESKQAMLQQSIIDLTASDSHPNGVPAVFNQAPPAPPKPLSPVAAAVAAAPPGSWSQPGAPVVRMAPTAPLMMADPGMAAARAKQQQEAAASVAASEAFQKLLAESQQAQMTHRMH